MATWQVMDFWEQIARGKERLSRFEDATVWRMRAAGEPWGKIESHIKKTRAMTGRECFGPEPETILRACLMCREDFRASSKFQRMCERCKKRAYA